MPKPPMLFVFPDTHALLHFKTFTDIDWSELFGRPVVLVIATAVLEELDTKKYEAPRVALQERARTILSLVHRLDESGDPRFSVFADEKIDWDTIGLDPKSQDSKILAQVLLFQSQTKQPVVIATGDSSFYFKAKAKSVQTFRIPDELRFRTKDDRDKEIEELRRENQAYKNRFPKLRMGFSAQNGELTTHKILSRQPVRLPAETGFAVAAHKQKVMITSQQRDTGVSSERMEAYYQEYREYLEQRFAWRELQSRTLYLSLTVYNEGSAPAEDIDILLYVPEHITAHTGLPMELPEEPALPKPDLEVFTSLVPTFKMPPGVFIRKDPEPWKEKSTVRYHLPTLKHGIPEELPPFWLEFPEFSDVRSTTLPYRMLVGSPPNSQSGELHLVVNEPS